jgi:hypothetical protein
MQGHSGGHTGPTNFERKLADKRRRGALLAAMSVIGVLALVAVGVTQFGGDRAMVAENDIETERDDDLEEDAVTNANRNASGVVVETVGNENKKKENGFRAYGLADAGPAAEAKTGQVATTKIESRPSGAKVELMVRGKSTVLCATTPCDAALPERGRVIFTLAGHLPRKVPVRKVKERPIRLFQRRSPAQPGPQAFDVQRTDKTEPTDPTKPITGEPDL